MTAATACARTEERDSATSAREDAPCTAAVGLERVRDGAGENAGGAQLPADKGCIVDHGLGLINALSSLLCGRRAGRRRRGRAHDAELDKEFDLSNWPSLLAMTRLERIYIARHGQTRSPAPIRTLIVPRFPYELEQSRLVRDFVHGYAQRLECACRTTPTGVARDSPLSAFGIVRALGPSYERLT